MCRLYAYRGERPAPAAAALVGAPNALVRQSSCDLFGECHADGWGIGYYLEETPTVERGTEAAFVDERFRGAAERLRARTVLAHVRKGSVGDRALANTHPFVHRHWLFAHNGTVSALAQVGPELEREARPGFLIGRRGTTDSELVFCWLLSRMADAGIGPDAAVDVSALAELFAAAVVDLAGRCAVARDVEPARLNFVLTDGTVLLASRWGRSLHWSEALGAVEVCSEPTGLGHWQEVPDRSLLVVDQRGRASLGPLPVQAAAQKAGPAGT
jgi:glutamine amidotransferase